MEAIEVMDADINSWYYIEALQPSDLGWKYLGSGKFVSEKYGGETKTKQLKPNDKVRKVQGLKLYYLQGGRDWD